MRSNLYWVETGAKGRLAIMARPRAGDWLEDEIRGLKNAGVNVIVSLLTSEEVVELELGAEQQACEAAGLEFRSFPILDRNVPPLDVATRRFVSELRTSIAEGRSVAIHCRMGIGRASTVAASVMRLLGIPAGEALARLGEARGLPVPDTEEQRRWVTNFVP